MRKMFVYALFFSISCFLSHWAWHSIASPTPTTTRVGKLWPRRPAEARCCCSHPLKPRVQMRFTAIVQDDNFFYLSGWAEPGAALLIVPASEATG